MDTAKDYASSNIADINDGGVYNYVAISEVPFDKAYAMTEVQNIHIFKYINNENRYEEVPLTFDEATSLILEKNNYPLLYKSIKS